MIIIKRYPNRKLYNTDAKQYVTLDAIADLIKQGEEIQITDHLTGEDLTAVTLTQIIFEQEKKEGGFLPRSVLTGLIQSGGQTLTGLRRTLASPLELFQHVNVEIEKRIQTLISSGELDQEEGEAL
ncbi:MAG: polyhydroxyalkanoate synthesis regulator DNA-binding domain-containing protein, partial [Chloroflexota bacterium]